MSELLSQLGINGKLLLSQGVNFFIVLAVVTVFVYRPLLKVLNERKGKIELGLKGAREAEKRLAEIEEIKAEKIRESEKKAVLLLKQAEEKAGVRGEEILGEAEKRADELLEKAGKVEEQRRIEALTRISEESKDIIKKALAKMVELKPGAIDEALIEEVSGEIKKQRI